MRESNLPHLVVDRDTCEYLFDELGMDATVYGEGVGPLTVTVAERPMMSQVYGEDSVWPIPVGQRVEVGRWQIVMEPMRPGRPDNLWHPVATATVAEVNAARADDEPYRWHVTLTDIEGAA